MAIDLWVISFGTGFCNTTWGYNFRANLFAYQMENTVNTKQRIK